ncbi:MAG: ABC-2 transporter permease [Lachnospiraceae bacterium]|nr:ABC-2 transporter permease [Lachnospiraceae bacterium]
MINDKLWAFVRLDFVTIKPYFTAKNILIYVALAIYMAFMSKSIITTVGIGLMLATLNIGYPFALGEKCNMDALYIMMGTDRKTVVKGRYLFSLLLNLLAVTFTMAIALVVLFVRNLYDGLGGMLVQSLGAVLMISVLFLMIQAVQIPLFFKLGYAKAKFFSIFPFLIVSAFVAFVVMYAGGDGMPSGVNGFVQNLFESVHLLALGIVVFLVLMAYVSYRLSLVFYRKREF